MSKITILIFVIVLLLSNVASAYYYDWAYELTDDAKKIYIKKEIQIPCSELPELINFNELKDRGKKERIEKIILAIRDAGLFKDVSCEKHIQDNIALLNKRASFRNAYAFYYLRMGDSSQLKVLFDVFDREARRVGDHRIVTLFGFLRDWDASGRRLARHASYSDGAAAELLCSAIKWRRFLYGEEEFKSNWFKYGHDEGVEGRVLMYFFKTCK